MTPGMFNSDYTETHWRKNGKMLQLYIMLNNYLFRKRSSFFREILRTAMTKPLMIINNAGRPRPMLMTKITRSEKFSFGGFP